MHWMHSEVYRKEAAFDWAASNFVEKFFDS